VAELFGSDFVITRTEGMRSVARHIYDKILILWYMYVVREMAGSIKVYTKILFIVGRFHSFHRPRRPLRRVEV